MKKIGFTSIIMAAVFCLQPCLFEADFSPKAFAYEDSDFMKNINGDLNADGFIDTTDITMVSLFLIKDMQLSEPQQKSADLDRDGEVTLADLARYRQYVSKIIDKLNEENNNTYYGNQKHEFHVDTAYVDSTGFGTNKFNTLKSAIDAITDSSEMNVYYIYIHSDIDVLEELGGQSYLEGVKTSDGERQGIVLPDYVNLIGANGNKKVVLSYLPEASICTEASVRCVSPLNVWKHNDLKNIEIDSKNCRYALHSESNNNYEGTTMRLENCKLRHRGNDNSFAWQSSQAFGCGTGSAAKFEFINSEFISDKTQGLRIHTNSYQKANYVLIDGCHFKGAANQRGVAISAYGNNSEVGTVIYKNSLSEPKEIAIWKEDQNSVQTWDLYDYVNRVIKMHDE